MAFEIGDKVTVKKTEYGYSNWLGKVGEVVDFQNQGTRQYVRVSFGLKAGYIDVADFRLKKVLKK